MIDRAGAAPAPAPPSVPSDRGGEEKNPEQVYYHPDMTSARLSKPSARWLDQISNPKTGTLLPPPPLVSTAAPIEIKQGTPTVAVFFRKVVTPGRRPRALSVRYGTVSVMQRFNWQRLLDGWVLMDGVTRFSMAAFSNGRPHGHFCPANPC